MVKILFCDTKLSYDLFLEDSRKDSLYKQCVFCLATNQEELTAALHKSLFDLIFLNIELAGVCSIDLVKSRDHLFGSTPLVFITDEWKYVSEVYEVPHLCYLQKDKLVQYFPKLLEVSLRTQKNQSGKLLLQSRNHVQVINTSEIVFVERVERKSYIHMEDGMYETNEKISDLLARLGNEILKCHNSYLVNAYKVIRFSSTEVTMKDGSVLPVSRPHKNDLETWFQMLTAVKTE